MDIINIFESLKNWLPSAALLAIAFGSITLYRKLVLYPKQVDISESRWVRQLTLFFITLIFMILILLAMPISETMKGQLFNLLGIAITATIALSSTTFVGNTMAGFMLKAIDGIKPGDFIKIGEHTGRVSEQGLLHTEIQTEERNLTTLPNLYLVTSPVTVVRSSGTIVSAQVSLGYDIPRSKVEILLCQAGDQAGLKETFVQVLELGDFSVLYRVGGFLTDVKYLISFRSKLRGHMLDTLHENGIEIVSPNFMNQRVFDTKDSFIPKKDPKNQVSPIPTEENKSPEDLIFDKAEEAESKEKIKELIEKNKQELEEINQQLKDEAKQQKKDKEFVAQPNLSSKQKRLEKRQEYLTQLYKSKE